MVEKETKHVIVILSPGRSGSSLLMKALAAMGMSLSEEMIPGSIGNPEGFFEDSEIVKMHKELLLCLHTKATLPIPEGWLDTDAVKKATPILRKILEDRLSKSNTIWGFKDPRTVSFLPLWSRILNTPGIVPVFLLSVRDPATVVKSLKRQINREGAISELQWLVRITDALHYTGGDCFIVHYEDWFTNPNDLAEGLLRYTGLDQHFNGDLGEAVKAVIKPNLNRAVYDEYTVKNEYVLRLYEVLKDCRGDDFERDRLMDVVKKCRKTMDEFKGWYLEAHRCIGQQESLRQKIKKKTIKLDRERARWEKKQAMLDEIIDSPEMRLGKIIVNAFQRPGKNTLLMPYRLTVILLKLLFGRGVVKKR